MLTVSPSTALHTLQTRSPSAAESNRQTFNGHTYQVFDTSLTWHEAKAYCESLGGHLVTINSVDEQNFIETLLSDAQRNHYWIGATDEASEGNWRWITGEPWGYSNWDVGQPDNENDRTEHYAHIFNVANPHYSGSKRFGWNDLNANGTFPHQEDFFGLNNFGFICE